MSLRRASRRMVWAAMIGGGVAACGRIDFATGARDASDSDAPRDAGSAQLPTLVAATGSASVTSGTTVLIDEVSAGDLLVIGITNFNGIAVASIVDSVGTQLASAGAFAEKSTTSSEIWYEVDSEPTNSVTVTTTSASTFDVFVAEFSGVHQGAPASIAKACLEYPPTIVSASATTTVRDELVVSATMNAAPLNVSQMLPPFTGFTPLSGNDAGFYVAPELGTYGTTFTIASGSGMAAMTCASTAVWLPGP